MTFSTAQTMNSPYLSVVVTSRNDNHGGTLLRRMQIFSDCLIAQCKRHDLPAELIVVEWNPPADRGPLMEALRWPADLGPCNVRFITVPPDIHARYKHGKHLPLYQMIAKNVGIRRARGEFILATNIDVILNDELMAFIAQRKLEKGRMYRIDRTDADALAPENAPLDEVLDYCKTHVLRINAREGTFPMGSDGLRVLAPVDVAGHQAIVSLGLGWYEPQRDAEGKPYRWVDNDAEIWLRHPAKEFQTTAPRYMTLDIEPGPAAGGGPFFLRVVGPNTTPLATEMIRHRRQVTFPIAFTEDRLEKILLHADPFIADSRPAGLDPRRMNFMVRRIQLSDAPPASPASAPQPDITDPGIVTGVGWYAAESAGPQPFRWLNNDADLWLESQGRAFVELDLEPGPSQHWGPFLLHVEGSDGFSFKRIIMGRRKISIPLPASGSQSNTQAPADPLTQNAASADDQRVFPKSQSLIHLKLRIGGAPHPVPGDQRILNARVYGVRWADARADETSIPPRDVAAAGVEVGYGKGWHAPERHRGHWFRWADNDAHLFVLSDATAQHPQEVRVRIDRGPSLGKSAAQLEARDEDGKVVAQLEHASGILHLPLKQRLSRFVLHVDSPSRKVKKDPRILNFRVNGVELGKCDRSPNERPSEDEPALPPFLSISTPGPSAAPPSLPAYLHTNACGDFTLLHRDHWFELRGYAEWDVFSLNIDSLFCFTAHHGGAPETVLREPMRLYHIEHNVGSGWTPEGQQLLIERIRNLGIPDVHWTEVAHLASLMNTRRSPILFCGANWGLGDDSLPETAVNTGAPAAAAQDGSA